MGFPEIAEKNMKTEAIFLSMEFEHILLMETLIKKTCLFPKYIKNKIQGIC